MNETPWHPIFYEIIGRIIRGLLHDLNGPLSSIIGFSSKNVGDNHIEDNDWNIVYEQGKKLSEKIRIWQHTARLQIPNFIGDIKSSGEFVLKCFTPIFSGKIGVDWVSVNGEKAKNFQFLTKISEELQIYFWLFVYSYFLEVLENDSKGILKISCDEQDDECFELQIYLDGEVVNESDYARRIRENWMDMLKVSSISTECDGNKWAVLFPVKKI